LSVYNAYMALSGALDADVRRDERLSMRTTFHIGGPAALYATVHSYPALRRVIERLGAEDVPWVVLGRGSNILAADAGYRGCVIRLGREFSKVSFGKDGTVSAGAGATLSRLVTETLAHSLSGLEFCVGIPGTVGGAVSMDAGTRHEWIGPLVSDLVTYKPGEGLRRYQGSEVEWGYRWTSLPGDEIILEANLALRPGDKAQIGEEMDRRLSRRRTRQPLGSPSCGSVFRNPGDRSAGRLIEECGLKGYRVGGAIVSTQHANFVVNDGGATAADVVAVIRHVHDEVAARFGVELTPEVKCLGFEE
jgi:UDP-N-acetylmuramate dehydrogenase